MVLDTCYSNGAYRKVDNFLPVGGKSLDSEDDEGFGNSRKILASRLLGAKDLFLDEKETGGVRPTSGAASDGWGKVLISASDAGERSWESDSLRNSFFTYYFISGMSQTKDVKSAFEFAKPRVSDGVSKEKEQIQTPQVVSDQRDWAIRF